MVTSPFDVNQIGVWHVDREYQLGMVAQVRIESPSMIDLPSRFAFAR